MTMGMNKTKQSKKCQHKDILSCPYKKRKECPSLKSDCHLPDEIEFENKSSNSNSWYIIALSILLIIISISKPIFADCIIWPILQSLSISVLAGVVLSKLIDIPKQLQDITKLISTSLTSYEYLYGLDRLSLGTLRNKVTHALYTKNTPNMPRGLIMLDQKICELLEDPYYKIYRETIECHNTGLFSDICLSDKSNIVTDTDTIGPNLFIAKDVTLEYTIKSPYDASHLIKADIGINNHMFLPEGCNIDGIFRIEEFLVSIDGNAYKNIMPYIKVTYDKRNAKNTVKPDEISYNTGLHLHTIDNKCLSKDIYNDQKEYSKIEYADITNEENFVSHIDVLFMDEISVKLKYRQLLPEADKHFTKRLKYSTESYRIDYSCDENNIQLFGQLFGPMIDQSHISVQLSDDRKKLSMESFSWLLPGSGSFVVMGNKLKNNANNIQI